MTAEQQARDLLERAGVGNAQNFSAGELVELANLVCERNGYRNDAIRYRKLRAMALGRGNLGAFVACESLDYTCSEKEFDAVVDQGPCE
jgi:hypothetical protein